MQSAPGNWILGVLAVCIMSVPACGSGDNPSPASPSSTPSTPSTAAEIAPSLGAEINSSFIAAMQAGAPMASRATSGRHYLAWLVESLISPPVFAQSFFFANCSRGGDVRIQFAGTVPGAGRVTLADTPVAYSNCGFGPNRTASGTLTANGTWDATEPHSPVRLSGVLTVNEIGNVAVDGSTGSGFSGTVGGVAIGAPDTPAPPAAPAPSPTPAPSPAPAPAPAPAPTPAPAPPPASPAPDDLGGRWLGSGSYADGQCSQTFDLEFAITQTGSTIAGTVTETFTSSAGCDEPVGTVRTGSLSGTVNANTVSFRIEWPGGEDATEVGAGSFTSTRMSGSIVSAQSSSDGGPFSVDRQ